MKKIKTILMVLTLSLIAIQSNSQTGTQTNPFTSLNQAVAVPSAGIYYFNISGVLFDTYVDTAGYVQIAIDFGNGTGNLPQSNSLTTVNRGIMTPAVLASLVNIAEVRISSSTGNVDVVSTNAIIISRIQNNTALHRGPIDTTINKFWVGTIAGGFTGTPTVICGPGSNNTLNQKIFHSCGDFTSFTWIPYLDYQKENWTVGEVANNVSFQLWVRGGGCTISTSNDVITACNSYTWIDGNTYTANNNTATDTLSNSTGCDSIITLDLTINTVDVTVTSVGASISANSTGAIYQWLDCNNGNGIIAGETNQNYIPSVNGSYAVQVNNGTWTDTSACTNISTVGVVKFEKLEGIKVFPNPITNKLFVQFNNIEFSSLEIINSLGQIIYSTRELQKEHNSIQINTQSFIKGVYFVKLQSLSGKIHRETIIKQ